MASVILIIFGLFVAYYSYHTLKLGIMISPGAGFLPFFVGLAMMILGIIWFFLTLLVKETERSKEKEDGSAQPEEIEASASNLILSRLLPGILLIIIYAFLFERIGYFISTLLFMVGWQKVVERESWQKTAVISLLCAGGLVTLFSYLLKVYLPSGSWLS